MESKFIEEQYNFIFTDLNIRNEGVSCHMMRKHAASSPKMTLKSSHKMCKNIYEISGLYMRDLYKNDNFFDHRS